jgi:hypothetical protein
VGVRFLRDVAGASLIFDPFCGQGTVLAMANALGMHALGVEISPKRSKKAERLDLSKRLHLVSSVLINMSLVRAREQIKAAKEEKERQKAGESTSDNISRGGSDVGIKDEITVSGDMASLNLKETGGDADTNVDDVIL